MVLESVIDLKIMIRINRKVSEIPTTIATTDSYTRTKRSYSLHRIGPLARSGMEMRHSYAARGQ